MPEWPQMQALAERLDAALSGATLVRVAPFQFSAAKTVDPPLDSYVGRSLEAVTAQGKYLVFDYAGPRVLIHLSQGGRLDVEERPKATRPKGAVVRFVYEGAPSILIKEYGSQRKAGWWTVAEGDQGPLARLGHDPFSAEFEALLMAASDPRRIHSLLRDQKTVAGIGRGYADDILHEARLSPYASLDKLDSGARSRLLQSVRSVLTQALEQERKRRGGLPAKLSEAFAIHGRHGGPCPRCGNVMRRISYESYEITYCPSCQTEDKVLADRRLSRLVR